MKVLVTGGRDFTHSGTVFAALDVVHEEVTITVLIHGNARGADNLGALWAEKRGVRARRFKANWNKFGKAAGPMRNQQMINEGKPDLVVAFPGGRGTEDMIKRAQHHNIPVRKIDARS
jgi:hypothetical protein